MDELFEQTRGIYVNEPTQTYRKKFTKQIAFNVIPHIDVFMDDGSTKEEWKMVVETQEDPRSRHQGDRDLRARAGVRRPRRGGQRRVRAADQRRGGAARRCARRRAISVVDHRADEGYVTPAECVGEDAVFVSRIRKDSDGRERPHLLVRLRQPAQGRGAERRADRRGAGRRLPEKAGGGRVRVEESASIATLTVSTIRSLGEPCGHCGPRVRQCSPRG